MPTRETKPAPASAARFQGGNSSVAMSYIKAKPLPEPRVLTEEEIAAWEQQRQDDRELQQRQVGRVVPGGPISLKSSNFSGKERTYPVPPQPTEEQLEAQRVLAEQRAAVAAINEQKAAEEAVKEKAIQALQQEQAEAARLAHEERFREQWGDRGGPAILLRKNSPSYKGKR